MLGYYSIKKFWSPFFNKGNNSGLPVISGYTFAIIWCYIIARLWFGMYDSNNPNECKINSFGDIIIAPVYAIGCNIGKNRFDIKLN